MNCDQIVMWNRISGRHPTGRRNSRLPKSTRRAANQAANRPWSRSLSQSTARRPYGQPTKQRPSRNPTGKPTSQKASRATSRAASQSTHKPTLLLDTRRGAFLSFRPSPRRLGRSRSDRTAPVRCPAAAVRLPSHILNLTVTIQSQSSHKSSHKPSHKFKSSTFLYNLHTPCASKV